MQLLTADLWDCDGVLCLTTNGFVKNNGRAVMGAGVARQAVLRVPGIDKELGRLIRRKGNICQRIAGPGCNVEFDRSIVSFPVKVNWWEQASLDLIRRSAERLSEYLDHFIPGDCYLPKPGCGNGGLTWPEVADTLEPVLGRHNNLYIVDR